ncbi:MAG: DivIVA protein [Firmicutes bacterium ADurb.Bin193]|nr:MAG: DivIVA protein [Firmicutes bacterium ADurb.Bin193]
MNRKVFGTSLFGYKKSEVTAYIENASKEFSSELEKLYSELGMLKKESENLQKIKEEYELSKDSIARALIRAGEQADIIIEEARKSAALQREKVAEEIEREKEKLRLLKKNAADLRVSISQLITRLDGDLERLTNTSDD